MHLSDITVLDFETTGLNPQHDRVIEIAVVRCDDTGIVSQFSTLVKTDRPLAPKITELTGITDEDLKAGMDEETSFRILNRLIGSNTIVAHNAAFDLAFLHYGLMRFAGRSFSNDFIDTLTIARDRQTYPHTLTEMCKRYGVQLNGSHRALNDVVACWELLQQMNREKPVDGYVNQLGYVAKHGAPAWSPPHAELRSLTLKYA
ncbi:3'-5' exonuclease [Paenibacillus hodogayensis]|uniref:3'-5' exonuclease n=1 Tax=Paenibacillus hodogayensis TaxID=279208 RepID=A0ABV5VW05_9BACL